jgi:peptide/nickel transport system permease protein
MTSMAPPNDTLGRAMGAAALSPARRLVGRSRARMGQAWLRRYGIGAFLVGCACLIAVIGPWIAPYDVDAQDLRGRLAPPTGIGGAHILGTDALGRDVLSRLLVGARISLTVSLGATCLAMLVGTAIGLLAGYHSGWFDAIVMRFVDVQMAFPSLLLALTLAALLRPSLPILILVLFVRSWIIYARLIRASVIAVKEREYVEAAVVSGASSIRILLRHITPSSLHLVVIISTFQLAELIILEASLSFLGLGIQPPTPSWGSMLSEGRPYMMTAWWLAAFPGLAIVLTVLGANILGDALRDWLDPRTKREL